MINKVVFATIFSPFATKISGEVTNYFPLCSFETKGLEVPTFAININKEITKVLCFDLAMNCLLIA